MDNVQIEITDSLNLVLGVLDVGNVKNFPLSLTTSISDLRDITTRSGSFSFPFKIPSTKGNDDVLEHIYLSEEKNYKDFDAEKDCIIRVNGFDIARGKLQITKINSLGRAKDVTYSFKFFGNNMDWVLKMKGYTTKDLPYLNKNLTYNDASVQASWQDVGGLDDVCYSFINRGSRIDPTTVNVGDYRPDYFVLDYIKSAFKLVGYNFESVFFNTSDNKQLIIPFFGKNFKIEQATIDANAVDVSLTALHSNVDLTVPNQAYGYVYKIKVPLINTCTSTTVVNGISINAASVVGATYTENVDGGNNFSGGFFVAPVDGYYKVNGFFETLQYHNATTEQSAGQLSRYIKHFVTVNSNASTSYMMNTLANGLISQSNPALVRETWTRESNPIFLVTGDTVRIDTEMSLYNSGTAPTATMKADVDHANSSYYTIDLMPDMAEGDVYNWADKSDDKYEVFDIVMDIFRIFNCLIRTNESIRTVYVEPRDDFYNALSTATNKTDYIDDNIQIQLEYNSKTYRKNHSFKYAKDDNDAYVAARNKDADTDWLSYDHTYPDKFKDGTVNYSTKVIAPTYVIEDLDFFAAIPSAGAHTLGAYTSRLWNDADTVPIHSDNFAPRILYHYYGYQKNSTGTRSHMLPYRGNVITQYGYALPYTIITNFANNGYAIANGCLSFVDVDSTISFLDGLWKEHFSKTSQEIEKGKRLKLNMLFDLVDWINLDFREIIYFDNRYPEIEGYWRLEKVNAFNPLGTSISTSIELIQARTFPSAASDDEGEIVEDGFRTSIPNGGGDRTVSNGNRTIIDGYDNYARNGNHVVGHHLRAAGENQLIMGMYNSDSSSDISTDLFQLGTGTVENPKSLIRVDKDGKTYFNGSLLPNPNPSGSGLVVAISADTTADVNVETYCVDTSAANVTVTLPTVGTNEGKKWNIKKVDTANSLIIVGATGTIDGSVDVRLTTLNDSLTIQFDGTNFKII